MNDAAALAQADVGLSFGSASNIAEESSDLALLSRDPRKVLAVLELSARTNRILRQNLFFSFFYNAVAVPLAIAGWLNPLVAAVAMSLSSLTVVGNTARILRRPSELGPGGEEARPALLP
ncbi:MAG: cation-translocating P-type ATPase [Deltaproteobacteria bacterium]|nr:cation-translocating P-type ATPase [Deltaproteobacteria bacterium]